jgi:hypothetical protein
VRLSLPCQLAKCSGHLASLRWNVLAIFRRSRAEKLPGHGNATLPSH